MGFTEMVDDGNAGDDAILRFLAILNSCNFSGASGHARPPSSAYRNRR
jgi:hypothetical protein